MKYIRERKKTQNLSLTQDKGSIVMFCGYILWLDHDGCLFFSEVVMIINCFKILDQQQLYKIITFKIYITKILNVVMVILVSCSLLGIGIWGNSFYNSR